MITTTNWGGILRYFLMILSLAVWFAIGKFLFALDSVIDIVHFVAVPVTAGYFFIFRPKIQKTSIKLYGIYFSVIALLVLAYFIISANVIPEVRINWLELPLALYFLVSIYLVLWLLDKYANIIFRFVFARLVSNKIAFASIKNTLRFSILVFVVMPYLLAFFITHWVKFTDVDAPKSLAESQYSRVDFNAADGAKLQGWFINSQNHVSDSTVIIVSGRSAAKNLFLPYAKIFSETGYNVLLFDTRGNGSSSGHKFSFGIDETNDVIAAIDFVRKSKPESSNYIFGYGINEGAAALIGAAAIDERFTAVVCDNAGGYDIVFPDALKGYMPKWMERSILKMTKTFAYLNTGRQIWAEDGISERISQISPCPVLFTNSVRNDRYERLKTVELFTKAREPKKLWLAPSDDSPDTYDQYFFNIIQTFETGKTRQQTGNWRISRSDM
jgi:pimeloyl-ACP methyl ester carboxylesterase